MDKKVLEATLAKWGAPPVVEAPQPKKKQQKRKPANKVQRCPHCGEPYITKEKHLCFQLHEQVEEPEALPVAPRLVVTPLELFDAICALPPLVDGTGDPAMQRDYDTWGRSAAKVPRDRGWRYAPEQYKEWLRQWEDQPCPIDWEKECDLIESTQLEVDTNGRTVVVRFYNRAGNTHHYRVNEQLRGGTRNNRPLKAFKVLLDCPHTTIKDVPRGYREVLPNNWLLSEEAHTTDWAKVLGWSGPKITLGTARHGRHVIACLYTPGYEKVNEELVGGS